MMREIFPLRDPEHGIDCGPPTILELLSGKQQIAFAIKGQASLKFELVFRLYQRQIEEYLETLEKEYPEAQFAVSQNRLYVTMCIPYLCDTFPLTTKLTTASYCHDQTWTAVRDATRTVDSIYSRVLSLHIEKTTSEGRLNERPKEPAITDMGTAS